MQAPGSAATALALWGGVECTVNRVGDDYFCQMTRSGHRQREDDLERFASLGITALRMPLLWEHIAPDGLACADWRWADARLDRLQRLGLRVIAGLVHHGSGPRHTSLLDAGFADGLAAYAGAVARRYPWIRDYTPVNEPLTTARFAGLYGVWYPHARSEPDFVRALLTQCRATVLAMQAIRRVQPQARLVQTDDLGKTYATPAMAALADFYNERRWLGWDLLCGRVDRAHPLWDYLTGPGGAPPAVLHWFLEHPCAPDIIGVNHYITSERWLDEKLEHYPPRAHGSYRGQPHADIESARALAEPGAGIGPLLAEAWQRYGLPLAVTEAHIDAHREGQMRWLDEIWQAALAVRERGVDVRAVTVWALLGSFDWNCLVTACRGHYEPGPFDVRSPQPRPTALATQARSLAAGERCAHPVLAGHGWWRREGRHLCAPAEVRAGGRMPAPLQPPLPRPLWQGEPAPILIAGARGTLGRAFARLCAERDLAHRVLARPELDIADAAAIEAALQRWRPWAVINAGGYVRVDEAETDPQRCLRENVIGPALLAAACRRRAIRLLSFSSDLVFDGRQQHPYVESDAVAPLGVYGRSKAEAERRLLAAHPQALVVRTSAFFGPWDRHNFLTQALRTLAAGQAFTAADDLVVSPTYVPDLVHACLDLLIDGEAGLWHLANDGALSWHAFAAQAAHAAGIDASRLRAGSAAALHGPAVRPAYSVLASQRARLLPSLADALARYVQQTVVHASQVAAREDAA